MVLDDTPSWILDVAEVGGPNVSLVCRRDSSPLWKGGGADFECFVNTCRYTMEMYLLNLVICQPFTSPVDDYCNP